MNTQAWVYVCDTYTCGGIPEGGCKLYCVYGVRTTHRYVRVSCVVVWYRLWACVSLYIVVTVVVVSSCVCFYVVFANYML